MASADSNGSIQPKATSLSPLETLSRHFSNETLPTGADISAFHTQTELFPSIHPTTPIHRTLSTNPRTSYYPIPSKHDSPYLGWQSNCTKMKRAEPHPTFIVFHVGLQNRYLRNFLLSKSSTEFCLVSFQVTCSLLPVDLEEISWYCSKPIYQENADHTWFCLDHL